jgi:lysine decarboxylase
VLDAAAVAGPVAALVLVSPSYQGQRADLPALVALAQQRGLPVLVDQAHGRAEALSAGADLVVLSSQKAAGGLAQSAALLLQGQRVDRQALARALLWLQTSSPSALLLASAEAGLTDLTSPAGQGRWRRACRVGERLQRHCRAAGLTLVANDDPLRLVLNTAALGINGLAADAWLLERQVIAELPEPGALTFCLGLAPPAGLVWRLPRQLERLRHALGGDPLPPFSAPPLPLVGEPELPLGLAWRASCEVVTLAAAVGRIAAEPLCPYPPGIPLLVPGERIDPARAAWLQGQASLWPGQIADTVKVVAA